MQQTSSCSPGCKKSNRVNKITIITTLNHQYSYLSLLLEAILRLKVGNSILVRNKFTSSSLDSSLGIGRFRGLPLWALFAVLILFTEFKPCGLKDTPDDNSGGLAVDREVDVLGGRPIKICKRFTSNAYFY